MPLDYLKAAEDKRRKLMGQLKEVDTLIDGLKRLRAETNGTPETAGPSGGGRRRTRDKKSLASAVIRLLEAHDRPMKAKEISQTLILEGFQSHSKGTNIQGLITNELSRQARQGRIWRVAPGMYQKKEKKTSAEERT